MKKGKKIKRVKKIKKIRGTKTAERKTENSGRAGKHIPEVKHYYVFRIVIEDDK